MKESPEQFEKRKGDHIRIALDSKSQTTGQSGLDQVNLLHNALPEMDLKEVTTVTSFFSSKNQGSNVKDKAFVNLQLSSPLFISSMTAGHENGVLINERLAGLSARHQILMGVGSQRRELFDPEASKEWRRIRSQHPKALLLGNLGLSQLIQTPIEQVLRLIENLEAVGLFVHLNPLQEALQPEGTPQFRGGLEALRKLVEQSPVPVIVKETGSGMSVATVQALASVGVDAVDVSGMGGTHWGRIEGFRTEESSLMRQVAASFANWGHSTVESVLNAKETHAICQIWASGGIRTGVDAAKMLALGADMVGLAQPFLQPAIESDEALEATWLKLQKELQIAMFCTGVKDVREFKSKKVWKWQKS